MNSVSAANRCLLSALIVVLFLYYTQAQCISPSAVVFENKCFEYFSSALTWLQAQSYCSSFIGSRTLARVSSTAEMTFLNNLKTSGSFWVGASMRTDGTWTWTDLTEANLTSLWEVGEPNNRDGDEKCVEIANEGQLNDVSCNVQRPFACMELNLVQTTGPVPSVVSTTTTPVVTSTVSTSVAPGGGGSSNNLTRVPGPVGFTAVLFNTLKLVVNQVLVYNKVVTNAGNAYNIKTGVFTCQTAGMYFFQVHCTASKGSKLSVSLVMNKTKVVTLHSNTNQDFTMAGNSAVLQLKVGDKVFVQASSAGSVYGTTSDFLNTFSGFLMQTSGV